MKTDSSDVEVVIAAGEQPAAPEEDSNLLRAPSDLLRWFGLLPQRKGSDVREKIARELSKESSYTWLEAGEPETAEAAAAAVVAKVMETVDAVEAAEAAAAAEKEAKKSKKKKAKEAKRRPYGRKGKLKKGARSVCG